MAQNRQAGRNQSAQFRLPDSCETRQWMTRQNRPEYTGPIPGAETEPTLPESGHNHASINCIIRRYWPESGFQREIYPLWFFFISCTTIVLLKYLELHISLVTTNIYKITTKTSYNLIIDFITQKTNIIYINYILQFYFITSKNDLMHL